MKIHSKSALLKFSKADLMALALKEHDVAIDPEDMEKKEIVGYILALQDGKQEVEASDEEAAAMGTVGTANPTVNVPTDPNADDVKVKIIIHKSDGIDGGADVKVGVNGYVRVIKREYEVIVPRYVYKVLLDAKQDIYESVAVDGGMEQRASTVQRFPVSFLGEA